MHGADRVSPIGAGAQGPGRVRGPYLLTLLLFSRPVGLLGRLDFVVASF